MGLANTFKALSDPFRRSILELLKEGEKSAGEIAETLGLSPAALSYHLSRLKQADLLLEYKVKNFVYYRLNATLFADLVLWLKQFEKGEKL